MATWYAQKAANWDSVSGGTTSDVWNDAVGGGGNWLDIAGGYAGHTFRGKASTAVAINVDVTCTQIDAVGNTGTFTIGANITIAANLVGGNASTFLVNSGTPTVTITGTVTGGSATCLVVSVAGSVTITGNVTGGSASASYGVSITAAATVAITGNVLGGSNASAHGIYATSSTAVISITGNVTASTGRAFSTNGTFVPLTVSTGNIVDTATVNAIVSALLIYAPGATNYYRMRTAGATTIDLYYDLPSAANVRETDTVAGVTGTVLTRTLSNADDHVHVGWYDETTLSTVDADLAVANIVTGKTIFGFAGEAAGGGGGSAGRIMGG